MKTSKKNFEFYIVKDEQVITPDDIKSFIEKYPEQKNFAETLIEVSNGSDSLDFHKGNFMKRGNIFVITDPY